MKIFNTIEEALDYAVDAVRPVDCGVFADGDNPTSGTLYTCFPSRCYNRRGQFVGLHPGQERYNPETHKWESIK
ncbi:MAG: hypothetical protein PHY02_06565 [Phycisphaerae bacterium]|nr:hypothetical protein [Phycisphaerae bacterium]